MAELVSEELVCLENIPLSIWTLIAKHVPPWHGAVLRDQVLQAANASVSYLCYYALDVVAGLPYSLGRGDTVHNMRDLLSGPEPPEENAKRGKRLLERGKSLHLVGNAFKLLAEAPFSTKTVEQPHGSIACSRAVHPELSTQVVATRAALHQCRHIAATDPDDRIEARLLKRIETVERKRNRRVSANNMHWKAEMARAKAALGNTPAHHQMFLAQCSEAFKTLPPQRKRQYEAMADTRTRANAVRNLEELQHRRAALSLFRRRRTQERLEEGVLNNAAALRYNDADWGRLHIDIAAGGSDESCVCLLCEAFLLPDRPFAARRTRSEPARCRRIASGTRSLVDKAYLCTQRPFSWLGPRQRGCVY